MVRIIPKLLRATREPCAAAKSVDAAYHVKQMRNEKNEIGWLKNEIGRLIIVGPTNTKQEETLLKNGARK